MVLMAPTHTWAAQAAVVVVVVVLLLPLYAHALSTTDGLGGISHRVSGPVHKCTSTNKHHLL